MIVNPAKEQKIWGTVSHVFLSPASAVSLLKTVAGYRCSWHHHERRYNQFVVVSGALMIEEDVDGSVRRTVLRGWQALTVPPGIVHRFRVLQGGEVIEVYWTDSGTVDISDIVRKDEGGVDEEIDEVLEDLRNAGLYFGGRG